MNAMLCLFNFGGGEVILILCVILIFFGAKKLPELAKGLGTGIKEFKKATREITEEVNNAVADDHQPLPARKIAPAPVQPVDVTVAHDSAAVASTPTPTVKRID